MRRTPWLVFGAIGVGAILAGACGGDDDGGGSSNTDGTSGGGTSGGGTTSSTTNPNTTTGSPSTTGNPNTTTGSNTTGSAGGGSGGEGGSAGGAGEGGMGGEAPVRPSCTEIPSRADGDDDFTISSPDFDFCESMPEETTCDGKPFPESALPELSWTEGPEGTESYAITFTDVTILATLDPTQAVYNRGYHYVIWNIPADTTSLPAELGSGFEVPGIEGALQWSPFNDYGYMGPCANFPDPTTEEVPTTLVTDSYSFTVYAMPDETLPIPAVEMGGPSFPRMMDDYLKENALAAAEYRGTSNALATTPPPMTGPTSSPPCPSEGEAPEGCVSAE